MSAQCEHCTYKGNLEKCKSASCSFSESWYSIQCKSEISRLTAEVKAKDVEIAPLKADISEQSGIIQRDWTSPYERQAMDKTIATLKANLKDQAADYARDTEGYLDDITTLKAQVEAAEELLNKYSDPSDDYRAYRATYGKKVNG
jgi:predicted RNase H-like nuclease (RuvC/YqgF family)